MEIGEKEKREKKERIWKRTQVTYVQCCSNDRLFRWTTRCHVCCCSFPPQSTTFSLDTHPHPYPYHTSVHSMPSICYHILHNIYITQRKHKHPRGYRHTTPRPIDKPSLESPSCRPFTFHPGLSQSIMSPSHQEKQVFLSMAPLVLSFYLVQATYMFLRRSFSRSVYFRSYLCYFSLGCLLGVQLVLLLSVFLDLYLWRLHGCSLWHSTRSFEVSASYGFCW
jgi:hypothetical protein